MLLSMVFIVGGSAISAGMLYVIRRFFAPPGGYYHDAEIASGIFGVVGTGYAVLLGFVIFSVFGSYDAARQDTASEAVALRQLTSTAGYFNTTDAQVLRGQLICYGRAVVSDEWPAMQDGTESATVTGWVKEMETTTQGMPVETVKESAALQNWFQQNAVRQDGRRGRIAESAPFVPGFVWALLDFLLFVVIFYQCLFAEPRVPLFAQAVGIVAMACTLIAGLSLVWLLDRPFNDRGAMISSGRIQAVVTDMEHAYLAPAPALPCDVHGMPKA